MNRRTRIARALITGAGAALVWLAATAVIAGAPIALHDGAYALSLLWLAFLSARSGWFAIGYGISSRRTRIVVAIVAVAASPAGAVLLASRPELLEPAYGWRFQAWLMIAALLTWLLAREERGPETSGPERALAWRHVLDGVHWMALTAMLLQITVAAAIGLCAGFAAPAAGGCRPITWAATFSRLTVVLAILPPLAATYALWAGLHPAVWRPGHAVLARRRALAASALLAAAAIAVPHVPGIVTTTLDALAVQTLLATSAAGLACVYVALHPPQVVTVPAPRATPPIGLDRVLVTIGLVGVAVQLFVRANLGAETPIGPELAFWIRTSRVIAVIGLLIGVVGYYRRRPSIFVSGSVGMVLGAGWALP